MALFGRKKNTEKKAAPAEKAPAPAKSTVMAGSRDLSHVLRHARITEKATINQMSGVYVFDIATSVSKRDIMQAVKSLYNVTPRKVAVVTIPKKNIRSMRTGRTGVKGGGKKAYVYLKKGDTITIA